MSDPTFSAEILVTEEALLEALTKILGGAAGSDLIEKLLEEHKENVARSIYPILRNLIGKQ